MPRRPSGNYHIDYSQEIAVCHTRFQSGMLAAFLIFMFALPLFAGASVLAFINLACIALIAVLGLNILTGYAGQISLGQAAFMAVGAYSSAILVNAGLSFWVALPCAAVITGLVGIIFGAPSFRTKGFYLAMTTIAAQFIIMWIVTHSRGLTGGTSGLITDYPKLGSLVFDTEQSQYYLIIVVTVIMTLFAKNLARSKIGRTFVSIRDNDIAATAIGINVYGNKILAFFICSLYAGVAGSLWAHYLAVVSVEQFTLMNSIWYLGMLIVGGMGTVMGAIFGTLFFKVLELFVSSVTPVIGTMFPAVSHELSAGMMLVVFGLAIALFLMFEPRGLEYRWSIAKATSRLWPFSY